MDMLNVIFVKEHIRTYKNMLEFKAKFINIIEELTIKINEHKQRIKGLKGFTQEKTTFINSLNEKILSMNMNEFSENKSRLLAEEQKLQIIYNFITKNKPGNKIKKSKRYN
jgi:hypothetical protein